MLIFTSLYQYKPGILFEMLTASYKELIEKYNLSHKNNLVENWRKFDEEAFANPKIAHCIIVSCVDNKPVGFTSHDPRQKPTGIIGHNCILPEHQGKGYGQKQVFELLKRLKGMDFHKVKVTTGDHQFFLPAQKMYLNCGFKEIKRYQDEKLDYPVIEYEIGLTI